MPSAEDIKNGAENFETVKAKLKQNKAGKCKREHCCQKKPVVSN
jgi:hypothetical protein